MEVNVECSFRDTRQVKTRLMSRQGDNTLDQAMPVCNEDPSTLSDDDLATIVTYSKT